MSRWAGSLFALGLGLSACASPPPPFPPAPPPPLEVLDEGGTAHPLSVRVCRPAESKGLAPLAIINHGAPPRLDETPFMQPTRCDSEPAQWFTARGYVVVFALRRGFGGSFGPIAEESGSCEAPDYIHAGLEGARDIDAAVRWAEALPGVRHGATIVVGQSTGGWASLAYASRPDSRAIAVINMAGGRGGRAFGDGGTYCHAERLVSAAARFGSTAAMPTLWIYARNDSYFTPDLAHRMHRAFVTSGGQAEFVEAPAFGSEGHLLFYGSGGSAIWGPLVQRFLEQTRAGARPSS